ncbi:MAG: hypothetical protein WAS07_02040 [Micropruina sp.]
MIAEALRGELSGWRGLNNETVATLTDALAPVGAVIGPTYAERRLGRFDKFTITRQTEPVEIEVWVPGGASAVALVEFDDPPTSEVDALLDSLGAPEDVQHNQRWRTGMLVDEYVYASRGLSLSVATPSADVGVTPIPRDSRQIVHVQLFRPMTVDEWRAGIGAVIPLRPFPRR